MKDKKKGKESKMDKVSILVSMPIVPSSTKMRDAGQEEGVIKILVGHPGSDQWFSSFSKSM
jgi:hypothetical protein